MNIWHDIAPARITPERFAAVIEIRLIIECINYYNQKYVEQETETNA